MGLVVWGRIVRDEGAVGGGKEGPVPEEQLLKSRKKGALDGVRIDKELGLNPCSLSRK